MFESDANLWLQSLDAPWLLWCMLAVSELGTTDAYMAAFLVLAFGVRLRPMAGVLLALVLAGAATGIAKLGFALPRPSEVDARVLDKGERGRALVEEGAADRFWGLPDAEAIETVRAAGAMDYGFISGHASAAMAWMLGIALLFGFRRRRAWTLAIGWALLVGVSRMYLGRHFLGDVLGGWLAGALAAWAAWAFVQAIEDGGGAPRRAVWTLAVAAVAALFAASFSLLFVLPGNAGEIAGALACLWLLQRLAVPDERGAVRRILRVLLAFALAYGLDAALRTGWAATGLAESHPLAFAWPAAGYPLAIVGSFLAARALGLYGPPRPFPAEQAA